MSILIKGMEMPGNCSDCRFRCNNRISIGGLVVLYDKSGDDCRPEWCPLIEIPPHGRLVDADAIETELWSVRRGYQLIDDTQTADKIMTGIFRAERLLKEAPVVIDAEGK